MTDHHDTNTNTTDTNTSTTQETTTMDTDTTETLTIPVDPSDQELAAKVAAHKDNPGFDPLHAAVSLLWDTQIAIYDYADEYGEPGYSSDGPVILGDYWCRCDKGPDQNDGKDHHLHGIEVHFPTTFEILEDHDAELEWYDEWIVIDNKAYRDKPDSYSWQPSWMWVGGEPSTLETTDIEDFVEEVNHDPGQAIHDRIVPVDEFEKVGFEVVSDENWTGWYESSDADPQKVYEEFQADKEREFTEAGREGWWVSETDVVFVITSTEQFQVSWVMMYRDRKEDLEG